MEPSRKGRHVSAEAPLTLRFAQGYHDDMRTTAVLFAALLSTLVFAQQPSAVKRPTTPPGHEKGGRCCPTVYDAKGKVVGEMIRWDDRFPSIPLQGVVRYAIEGGGDTALIIAPESISSVQQPGGSVALFTTPDCSGNTMFAQLSWPPLMKRYSMVLPVAPTPAEVGFNATKAWLFVTDPLPVRTSPGATVFHSQWGEGGACVPYPAPGYTVAPGPFGGYWMHRVEDLYAKYKRPFYAE